MKSIELNPSLTTTYTDLVLGVLMPLGDTKEGLKQLEAARLVDPLSLDVRRIEAHVLIEAGRYNDAIDNCLWIRQDDPAFPYVDVWLARALYFTRRFDEAEVRSARGATVLRISGLHARRQRPSRGGVGAGRKTSRLAVTHDAHLCGTWRQDRAFEGLAQPPRSTGGGLRHGCIGRSWLLCGMTRGCRHSRRSWGCRRSLPVLS